jgi:CheY-like chemotaxis protein
MGSNSGPNWPLQANMTGSPMGTTGSMNLRLFSSVAAPVQSAGLVTARHPGADTQVVTSNHLGNGSNPMQQPTGNIYSTATETQAINHASSVQQRMFGLVNEAGTNLSNVPAGLVAPGQSFTFQRARFAVSGSELGQVLAQHEAGRANMMSSMLNRPGLNPIYRPDFYGTSMGAPGLQSQINPQSSQPAGPLRFPLPAVAGGGGFVPNFASVIAQRLPKSSGQGSSYPQPPWDYQAVGNPALSQMYHAFTPGMWQQQQISFAHPMQNPVGSSSPKSPALTHQNQQRKLLKRGSGTASSSASSIVNEDDAGRKKRKKRDPNLPTPARFAWNFYFRDQYTKIRNSEPSEHTNVQKAFTDIGFDLGKKWKSLSKEEKEPYVKMAALDKERYEREMQSRFSSVGSVGSSNAAGVESASSANGDSSEEDEQEKVGIVFHEIEVEDTRPESEKISSPTEGELVADVLIVDDDEVFLKIIRHKLVVGQKNPPKIVTVTNASDAKRMIVEEHKKFGTVLLDKDLGEGKEDGISSLAIIRESGYQGVIVGVTGSTDDQTRSQFTSSGADETFIKGTSNFYDDLLALVKLHSTNAEEMEKEDLQHQQGERASAALKNSAQGTSAVNSTT